ELEERRGYQSVPTKFHAHVYTWPPGLYKWCLQQFDSDAGGNPPGEPIDGVHFERMSSLPPPAQWSLGEHPLSCALSQYVAQRLETIGSWSFLSSWKVHPQHGLHAELKEPVAVLLARPDIFSEFLQPLAVALDEALTDL